MPEEQNICVKSFPLESHPKNSDYAKYMEIVHFVTAASTLWKILADKD